MESYLLLSAGTQINADHRIVRLEGASKAIESNPLLKAGMQIKWYLTDGCPISYGMEHSTLPDIIISIVIFLKKVSKAPKVLFIYNSMVQAEFSYYSNS